MIFDTLSNRALYRPLLPRLASGFDWLASMSPSISDGRHDIQGDDLFAIVQNYETGPAPSRQFETHRKYIDIQYMISGEEFMMVAPFGSLSPVTEYDADKDLRFYADSAAFTAVHCVPGDFTVFFTHDAHKGGCVVGSPTRVRKVVVKVRV